MNEDSLPEPVFSAVLDELIPARDSSLPGAGALGLGATVESRLGAAVALVASGLAALDALANTRKARDFVDLPREVRVELLREVAASHLGFVENLIVHLYSAYYQHPRVIEAIGLENRPPYPDGYELESGDLGLLDLVRERARLYRDA